MHAIQLVWILFSFIYPVFGGIRNITIDDTFGDGFGNFPNYQPSSAWEDANCEGCLIRPDRTSAHQGTWTAATYLPDIGELSMSIEFQGTAVYLFFILAAPGTSCNFTIDGQLEGSFHVAPTIITDLEYDQLVFFKTGLSRDRNHTVAAITSGQNQNYWIGFDYAVVTYDDSPIPSTSTETTSTESPSASSQPDNSSLPTSNVNVGAIAGGAIGGVALIAILIFVFFFYRLRQHRVPPVVNLMEEAPTSHQGGAPLQEPSSPAAAFHSIPPYPHPSSGSLSTLGYNNNDMRGSSGLPQSTPPALSSSARTSAVGMTSRTSLLSSPQNSASVTRRATLRDARQRELESQVAELRQQLTAVQAMANRLGLTKMREADEAEKNNLCNQVADMQKRMQQLEAAHHSPWAQGDSDETPPGYTPVQASH